MQSEIFTFTAIIVLAFFHTALGPDHYLPFIAMSRAAQWSLGKTAGLTLICGLGHILSSLIIGMIGVIFGVAIYKLEMLQEYRSEIAAWLLMAFGLGYAFWGIFMRHSHTHNKETGFNDSHGKKKTLTPWILFTIFVFGPCEVLIPMLMYYAAINDIPSMIMATVLFGVTTIITMLGIVLLTLKGIKLIKIPFMEKFTHPIAGLIIFLSGAAIKFLGL